MHMKREFEAFIHAEALFDPAADRILLSVSGGIDSMVMAHLFRSADYLFALAHCRYGLRGAESELDADLVSRTAAAWGVPYFEKRFDTAGYAADHGLSIQTAARQLRYDWLGSLADHEAFDRIATAHHLDDSFETALFNLANGTGLRGVRGIPLRRGRIVRPLLFAVKSQILAYAEEQGVEYREDASNRLPHYDRNKIRLQVVPVLRGINPGLEQTLPATFRHLREAEALYDFAVEHFRERLIEAGANHFRLSMQALQQTPAPATLLYEFLRPFGFGPPQIDQMLKCGEKASGQQFSSSTHRLVFDHGYLVWQAHDESLASEIRIDSGTDTFELPDGRWRFTHPVAPPSAFSANPYLAWIDLDRLSFPLTLRRWRDGDAFQPLGMAGRHRKLQDLFTDLKLSRFEKERVWVLENQGEICWVAGIRLDERYKVRPDTRRCLRVEWEKRED